MIITRDYLVELAKYLPEFLRQDPEMKAILKVESEEHRVQVEILKELQQQLFIDTATWGLALFEKNLGLKPNATDDYTQRRNRIFVYLQQYKTVNKEFIEELFSRYVSEGSQIVVMEDNPNNTFWVIDTGGTILYPHDLHEAIETYKPAHLLFGLQIERDISLAGEDGIKYGIANIVDGMANIGLVRPPDIILPYNVETLTGSAGRRQVGAGPVMLSAGLAEEIAFAYSNSGLSDIPANMNDLPEWIRSITKSSRILHKIGIAYDRKGRQKIPLALPTVAEVIRSPVILAGKSGGRLYSLALPEDARQCVHIGHTESVTGRGRLEADLSDLAEWIKRITEPSRVAVKIAIETMRRGKRTYHVERPPDAALAILAAAEIRAAGGRTVGIIQEDLPDFMRELKISYAMPKFGTKAVAIGARKVFPGKPLSAIQIHRTGTALRTGGKRYICIKASESTKERVQIGHAGAITGHIVIGADRGDLPPGNRKREQRRAG